jgi:proteasome lid subunit RPN8/RPN11
MNPPVYWPDDSLPLAIYCAPGVLTALEIQATDALLAMPRTGLGIGGLLLGRQSGERLEILKTVAISCSHAMGPSFVLTPEEIAEAKVSEGGVDEEYARVGWYCSKPNGRMLLSDNDRALFDALCGERGQVALLIRPSLGQATLATFALRGDGKNGDRFQLGMQGELVTPEKTPSPEGADLAAEPVAPLLEIAPPDPPTEAPPERLKPVEVEQPWVMPVMPRGGTLFGAGVERKKRRWLRRLLWVVMLLAILAAAAYLTIYYLPESGISK